MPSRLRKEKYFAKLNTLFAQYERMFIVGVDNVGSRQMQEIKIELRGKAEVLNGKNTQMRRAISNLSNERPEVWCLIEELKKNVAFVMTNGDLGEVKTVLEGNQKPAAARSGALAPVDVWIPKGPTGLDPAQTSFFQALNIPTKINKGSIEIIQDVQVIKAHTRVGPSEAALLNKLGKKPFNYGLVVQKVYEAGAVFDPSVLAISQEMLLGSVAAAIGNIAAVSLATNFPTQASLPYMVMNGFKEVAGVGLAADFIFEQIKKVKEMIDNPEAFASAAVAAAPTAAAAAGGGDAAPTAAAAAAPEEEEEEEAGGFDLFD
ncbi:hypothetical protein KFE25_007937 [Diacronema lutheri]|uniref:60S acidic ribosomal protein P0 n=1 Tax=Diacronema lutheri TaxID=2081491 RepID=A0A8J5XKR1_DIALT|nr:hypothetical protein KFE25_007937 [Diacronema lutheri]|mmetsp:Transcript_17378/g.54018  ORF Transcript_17378/g.54018 Transcript_17378/m.54018 type:complete len:318 (-) Transcript_17378:199-1152(-)